MAKYWRMLILLGTVVFLSTLTASGSLAQESQRKTGLYEDVFGRSGKVALELSEISELPLPVQLAMRTAISGTAESEIKITSVATEIGADGELIYAVDFDDPAAAAGRGSIDITNFGRVLQVEEAIAIEQLPPLISDRMERNMTWMSNLKVTEVWKSVRPDAIVYEIDGTDEQGNEIYIQIPEHARSFTMNFQAED